MSEEDKHFIKRYEELLDKGYCDCNEMNCIDNNSPRRILEIAKKLKSQLQQKENIIKEVREYIMTELITEWDIKNDGYVSGSDLPVDAITPLLEILDKENK